MFFVLRITRRCISVAPSRETSGELLLGKSPWVAHLVQPAGIVMLSLFRWDVTDSTLCPRKDRDVFCGGQCCRCSWQPGEELFCSTGTTWHYSMSWTDCSILLFVQSLHGETEAPSFSWTYEEIKEVHKRWWQLRDNAVEIFLTNGRTLLLAFDNTKVG